MITKELLYEFRHHYHRAKRAAEVFFENGSFGLNIKLQDGVLSGEMHTSDKNQMVTFAVLMRRFLAEPYDLFLPRIWSDYLTQFPTSVSYGQRQYVQDSFDYLHTAAFRIQIDGKDYSSFEIYDLISRGEFFNNEEEAAEKLRSLSDMPLVGPLFWTQFFDYSFKGLVLCSVIFEHLRKVDPEQLSYSEIHLQPEKNLCIYCRTESGSFMSYEHVFPESLGPHDAVLPPGFVCDKCNNETLSKLDAFLVGFEPISFMQVYFTPYTKSGKIPRADFQNISIERTGPKTIRVIPKDKTGEPQNVEDIGNGWIAWQQKFRGKPVDPIMLGRSIYKIGLGLVAFHQGQETALETKFNRAREFIMGNTLFPNVMLVSSESRPRSGFRTRYQPCKDGTIFIVDIFGVIFLFNLETTPLLDTGSLEGRFAFLRLDLSKQQQS